jgi:carbon monoxide dehydrogenase subunit G
MSKILILVGIVLAAAAVFVLVRAAMLPNDFRVSRSTLINAPREKVFALINDMNSFNQWNPFAKMDPSTKTLYRGPASGPNAAFDWEGTGKAGKGSLEIVKSNAPATVIMKLDIVKPMEGHNNVVFALHTDGDATDVSWTMTGHYPYVNRIFGAIFNMDKIIGGTFESGLADLKRMAEKG